MPLNQDQEALSVAVRRFILNSHLDYFVIQGEAGTGKTYWLQHFINELKSRRNFVVAAYTNAACNVIRSKLEHVKICTISQLLGWERSTDTEDAVFVKFPNKEIAAKPDDIIVIDEYSMVAKSVVLELLTKKKKGQKLIFIGDRNQLPPVNDDPFPWIPDFTLTIQERNKSMGEFVLDIKNKILSGQEILNPQDITVEMFPLDDILHLFDPDLDKIITYTNATKKEFNARVREYLGISKHMEYSKGDHIIFNKPKDIYKTGHIDFLIAAKESFYYPSRDRMLFLPDHIKEQNHLFQVYDIKLSDQKVITTMSEDMFERWHNLILEPLAHFARANNRWREFHMAKDLFADISYSYAITSHKSQGMTIRNSYVCITDIIGYDLRSAYVALTRSSGKTYLIT